MERERWEQSENSVRQIRNHSLTYSFRCVSSFVVRIKLSGEDVTRTNNRQDRIEGRDFVALDPEQTRIRTELVIDGIDYQLMRSETIVRGDSAFDLVEATTALACASKTVRLPVQLKREIGRLWDVLARRHTRNCSMRAWRDFMSGGVYRLNVLLIVCWIDILNNPVGRATMGL